jgi:hypothetical protein
MKEVKSEPSGVAPPFGNQTVKFWSAGETIADDVSLGGEDCIRSTLVLGESSDELDDDRRIVARSFANLENGALSQFDGNRSRTCTVGELD